MGQETGTETYEIATEEDLCVMRVAEIVQGVAMEERGIQMDVELVENPRSGETMVEEFGVDISVARAALGWEVRESVKKAVREELVEEE